MKRCTTAAKSRAPSGSATMISQSLMYISFIRNGSIGIHYRYCSIRFRNKNCDPAKKGSGYGRTKPFIM